MLTKLAMVVVAAGILGWALHRSQVVRAQKRLRELGQLLEAKGIDFDAWLREAGIDHAAMGDRRRTDEVQARLISAAERLLR